MSSPEPHSVEQTRISWVELEDLYENAPCGYLTLAPDGNVMRANATFCRWTGFELSDLIGKPFTLLLNIAGRVFFETHFAPMLRLQGVFNEVAFDMVESSGRRLPVLLNALERRNAAGEVQSIRITVFNATDRRRYERDLLAARNALTEANQDLLTANIALTDANQRLDHANGELNALYDKLPVGVFRATPSGEIVQASRRFCLLLGIEKPDQWASAIAFDSKALEEWIKSVNSRKPFLLHLISPSSGSCDRHLDLKAIPVSFSEGEMAILGVLEDVTDQRQAESQRLQLERFTTVRQLTGGLAHNLNNILMVLTGNLEALEDSLATNSQLSRIVSSSLKASDRAADLVHRLLIYAGYSTSPIVHSLLDQTLVDLRPRLAALMGKNHRLQVDLQARGASIALDSELLFETLRELVANAVTAMPDGGDIILATRLASDDGQTAHCHVAITVRDDGIGMDAITLANAREPFFSRQMNGRAQGLGLSLVDGVCRIADGTLTLSSQPGAGTTAELQLPIVHDTSL